MAPIEKTLDKIVKDGKSSLLVTDFEEFTPDRQVQHQSFASRYFTKWLKQGNDITFFIFDFVGEKGLTYHLYFTVFDNKSHQFLDQIRQSVAGITGYQEFHLSTDAYSVSPNILPLPRVATIMTQPQAKTSSRESWMMEARMPTPTMDKERDWNIIRLA